MEQNRHAYLIMAHNNYDILKKLISLLDHSRNDIYIHIDKKSSFDNFQELQELVRYSKIYIYKEIKVYWGHISQVNTEIFLLEQAVKNKYLYYHLLSGVDLPIKNQDYIHSFFEEHIGFEFVHFSYKQVPKRELEFVDKYHYFQKFLKINKYKIINKILTTIEKFHLFIQKIFFVKRNRKINFQKGANWFSITNSFAQYVISEKDWIESTFKYTKSADEFFLQTLLINSDFKNKLYNNTFYDDYHACMRYIDWTRGGPYIFKLSDFEALMQSDYLWARKFDSNVDKDIVEKIYSFLSEK